MNKIINKIKAFFKEDNKPVANNANSGGSYALGLTAIVLAIMVVINIAVSLIPDNYVKYDISSSQLYSITSNTKVVVNSLEKDVTIYWVVQADEEDDVIENLLNKYDSESEHVTVVKKNPDVYPTFTEEYTSDSVANNSLIVECGDKYRYIPYSDIYLTDIDYSTYSYSYSFDGEGAITSAIDYVTSDELPKMYVLQGHGETDLPSEFEDQITKENIETETLSLLNVDEIPEDADMLLIYAPTSDISEEEEKILLDYVKNGGRLLVYAGPVADSNLDNLYGVLSYYGVNKTDGIVIESDHNYYAFQMPYILLPTIESSDVTDALIEDNYYAIMPIAQGLNVSYSSATVTELLKTSDSSYSKVSGYNLETYEKENGDIDGPFTIGVMIENSNDGCIIWYTSSNMLEETFNSYSSGANLNLAMNSISELIGETESVMIRSKSLSYSYLTISDSDANLIKAVMIGVIPLSFIVIGICITVARRRKHND